MNYKNNITGKIILVTGGSGFIGKKLISLLDECKAQVHVVSRNDKAEVVGNICWYKGDLTDEKWINSLIKNIKPDIIYHLAGMVTGSQSLNTVIPMFKNTLQTTVNIFTSAAENGCGCIIMTGSMMEELGHECVPGSPYAAAKIANSHYARMFHALYDLPIINARIFMTYGPGQMDLRKIIPYTIIALIEGKTPRLSSGNRLVDWVFVDDVVEGLLMTAVCGNIGGTTVDIGSGTFTSIRDVVDKIVQLTDVKIKPVFGHLKERLFEPLVLAKVEDTQKKIGWAPKTTLSVGLEKTVVWYKKQHQKGIIKQGAVLDD